MASPFLHMHFLGVGDGIARPYKWFHTKKNSQLFHVISNEVKLYIKIVDNDDILNFVVDNLFIYSHLVVQKIIIGSLIAITIEYLI